MGAGAEPEDRSPDTCQPDHKERAGDEILFAGLGVVLTLKSSSNVGWQGNGRAWEHLDRVRESFYVLSLDFEINRKSM